MSLKLSESSLRKDADLGLYLHKSEAISIALYNPHIATHMTIRADGATAKSRAPVEEPNIEVGNPLVD